MTMLEPIGFWSYTSTDDESSRGRLSQLRRMLADELQQAVGRSPTVRLFQDVVAIPPGGEWEQQIIAAIKGASFFIPIITPGFLQSEWCCRELRVFRSREVELDRNDLIFPIHYNDVRDFNTVRRSEVFDPGMLDLLRTRQWVDFRDLRYSDLNGELVAKRIGQVAQGVQTALYRPVQSRAQQPPNGQRRPSQVVEPAAGTAKPRSRVRALRTPIIWGSLAALATVVLIVVSPQFLSPQIQHDPYAVSAPPPLAAPEATDQPPLQSPVSRSYLTFFDWDKANLTDRSRQILAEAAKNWQRLPAGTRVEVNGYDDTSQSPAQSMALSISRARAVADELVRNGIPGDDISIQGFGGTHWLAPTGPGVREPQNRRVEVLFK